jgi:hypothetical protein
MTQLITLIPNTGIQFWDVDLDLEKLPRLVRSFWEERVAVVRDDSGTEPVVLRDLKDEDGVLTDPVSGQVPPADEVYVIGRNQAIELFNDRFMPMPYFQLRARGQRGQEVYDRGPTNWVRSRLTEHPTPAAGRTHRLTLAFDTSLVSREPEAPYVALSHDDSERQREFVFVAESYSNSWFLDEVWVGDWLYDALVELRTEQRRGRPLRPEDFPHACEHYARYIVFLALLDAAELLPRVRLLDVVSKNLGYEPVSVDLVLDIGNSRTCGILIEEHPGEGINLSDSYPLGLRDLSRPELLHSKPFASRVEFCRASFGYDAISRRSGRGAAFAWSSPVRVGPEAVRLAGARIGNEGATGLSSPKRYLWDDRRVSQGWRFNGKANDGVTTDPPVGGNLMRFVTEDGNVPRRLGPPAPRARFSRSSMFTFMLTEILLQALSQMNAPGNRMRRKDADTPRRLRSLILTLPPGMPVAEQKILRNRAQSAVRLTWNLLGWTGTMPEAPVKATLDEATATQIVWLHNEISARLQGDAGTLLEMVGRPREDAGGRPSLRVASIDIGGGTTDLMITTYTLSGVALHPHQEFRESFKIAGDDVLERLITGIIFPVLNTALAQKGVADPKALLSRALGQDRGGQSEQERHLRRLFVSQVLEPIGLAILHAYEQIQNRLPQELLSQTVGDVLGDDLPGAQRALRYLENMAEAMGARDFRVAEVPLSATSQQVERIVTAILGPVLADLCEVVWHYDCDVLLLSGRPSRLRVVTDIVQAKTPVPPHRVIGMHHYRVGEIYPFRDAANRIDDPKTTAAVGAALCAQAEGRLPNFTLRTRNLAMRSTARIIGTMDNNGQIRHENELLRDLELDRPPTEGEVGFTLDFETVTQLGFRQLPIERWVTTPLYILEFANPDNATNLHLPLKVKVVRRESDGPDGEQDASAMEDFHVEEVEDAEGDRQPPGLVRMRLQTIREQDGYWRDTGRLTDI